MRNFQGKSTVKSKAKGHSLRQVFSKTGQKPSKMLRFLKLNIYKTAFTSRSSFKAPYYTKFNARQFIDLKFKRHFWLVFWLLDSNCWLLEVIHTQPIVNFSLEKWFYPRHNQLLYFNTWLVGKSPLLWQLGAITVVIPNKATRKVFRNRVKQSNFCLSFARFRPIFHQIKTKIRQFLQLFGVALFGVTTVVKPNSELHFRPGQTLIELKHPCHIRSHKTVQR